MAVVSRRIAKFVEKPLLQGLFAICGAGRFWSKWLAKTVFLLLFANVFTGVTLSTAWAASDSLKLRLSSTLTTLMTEIRYEDREPDEPAYQRRFLFLGERMRIDFGRDDEGFILFDRQENMVWHISPSDRRITGIAPGLIENVWPPDWTLSQENMPSASAVLSQVRLNGMLCVEFKATPLLSNEASLLRNYQRVLAANKAAEWLSTPEALREPCSLALNVYQPGTEYAQGLPLAIRYWDSRSRIYLGHDKRSARPDLFDLPIGYLRVVIEAAGQGNAASLQPDASQTR